MQSSTPASTGGETPWLLFVGILAMALVPALSSFMRLADFEGRLQSIETTSAKVADDSAMNRLQFEAQRSRIEHVEKSSLPAITGAVKKLGGVEDQLAELSGAQAEIRKVLDGLSDQAAASAGLLKELEAVDTRIDTAEKALSERLTKDDWDQLKGELVKAEEFRTVVAHLKEGQKVEAGKVAEALLEPVKRALEERNAKAAAEQAAQADAHKAAVERADALAKQAEALSKLVAELQAKVDELAKKVAEKPAEPPK